MKSTLYPTQELRRRAQAWAVKLRVNPRVIRVQAMRRKWGSCSEAGTVTLAADLLDESQRFQDYVIVHELLHLRVGRHGRLFKALLSAHVPGWQRLRSSAKANGRGQGFEHRRCFAIRSSISTAVTTPAAGPKLLLLDELTEGSASDP